MIKYYDECVECPPEIGCLGSGCRNLKVPHYFCDECGEEEDLYYFEGREVCLNCIKAELGQVSTYGH